MKFSQIEQRVADIVRPVIEDEGFTLYCVKIIDDHGQTVQVMAEDPATGRLGIDDCTKLSRAISAVMDVEDPINGAYKLELSSPGIDRFLIAAEHFERYKNFEVKVETSVPSENGQKRYRGVIESVNEGVITLQTDQGEEVSLPHDVIAKAKLVMTEDLIKATKPLQSPESDAGDATKEKN